MPISTLEIQRMKTEGKKISMLTAYDFLMAKLLDEVGIDIILVGDSVGNVLLGYENTIPVTMDEMIHHTRTVSRGCNRAMVVGDMPFMSYQTSLKEALHNAGRFLKEAGAQAVKLEGGAAIKDIIKALTQVGIPVMAHVGLTPQSFHTLGGFKVQGRGNEEAVRVIDDALTVEEAGAFSIVLEAIPRQLANEITHKLTIPTIGIGAGPGCDGQVLVTHDMLGLTGRSLKFVKKFADLGAAMREAVVQYMSEVKQGSFPADDHSFH